jgi:hypothetical protein
MKVLANGSFMIPFETGRVWRNTRGATCSDHLLVPESRRQVHRDYGVTRFFGTSPYCGRPTCFGTEAKDKPGPHFENTCDDGSVDAATMGGANVVCELDLSR